MNCSEWKMGIKSVHVHKQLRLLFMMHITQNIYIYISVYESRQQC